MMRARIINPLVAEGQVHGGVAAGIAQALFEELTLRRRRQPAELQPRTYMFPASTEFPQFELVAMETLTPVNPLGVKGIGESGTIGATPAVHNAVVDALSPTASSTSTCRSTARPSGEPFRTRRTRDRDAGPLVSAGRRAYDIQAGRFIRLGGAEPRRRVNGYDELWQWSVSDLEAFWGVALGVLRVPRERPYEQVLSGPSMPGAKWFTVRG